LNFERSWWWFPIFWTLSVPADGFQSFELWAYLMMVSNLLNFERTWWWFQIFWTLSVPDDGFQSFELWAYLMMVIPKMRHAHKYRYLCFYSFVGPARTLCCWRYDEMAQFVCQSLVQCQNPSSVMKMENVSFVACIWCHVRFFWVLFP
jgi:hypothetical protein